MRLKGAGEKGADPVAQALGKVTKLLQGGGRCRQIQFLEEYRGGEPAGDADVVAGEVLAVIECPRGEKGAGMLEGRPGEESVAGFDPFWQGMLHGQQHSAVARHDLAVGKDELLGLDQYPAAAGRGGGHLGEDAGDGCLAAFTNLVVDIARGRGRIGKGGGADDPEGKEEGEEEGKGDHLPPAMTGD